MIYLNDHPPAHVHVLGEGAEAIFVLHCPEGPPELRDNFGIQQRRLSGIETQITANLRALCEEWERIHGDFKRRL